MGNNDTVSDGCHEMRWDQDQISNVVFRFVSD
jgi:hypothetical protein